MDEWKAIGELTFAFLAEIIEKFNIPKDVHLISDSGWECDATEMERAFYNADTNTIVFTQLYTDFKYTGESDWVQLF